MKLTKKIGLLAVVLAIALPMAIVAAKHKKSTPPPDISGSWSGTYRITSPKACASEPGPWTANVIQSGKVFAGNYNSDLVYGTVSGHYSNSKNFIWTVRGNGVVNIKGKVTSPTVVSGKFTGGKCPGTHKKIKGSFSGTKQTTN